ncbi:MAG: exodeoxyribonuclease VII small subunit [Bacteroidetes bacterium RIFOXYA12_FULL_35_11]|nr:MAG: exodeoxyribonuclease VII small subunit [Bacteroidetes bacterium GWF2_35_48]OFY78687.1 MAG: exodeoxyribonuclease VII small subunit [Bacteroidetes bacterium RIFOXYA12_FULL_35_11]HBX53507.1 exodeoxyribonuclease VII small subunit [Bacteroidales bacterium]
MAKKTKTYNEAIAEIEQILEKIETQELDVDDLAEEVKKVSALIKLCKEKLHNTELEVQKVLDSMKEQ